MFPELFMFSLRWQHTTTSPAVQCFQTFILMEQLSTFILQKGKRGETPSTSNLNLNQWFCFVRVRGYLVGGLGDDASSFSKFT